METHALNQIDQAKDAEQALSFAPNTLRSEYIIAKRGPRSLGGFFVNTRANVRAKFVRVWNEEHA